MQKRLLHDNVNKMIFGDLVIFNENAKLADRIITDVFTETKKCAIMSINTIIMYCYL